MCLGQFVAIDELESLSFFYGSFYSGNNPAGTEPDGLSHMELHGVSFCVDNRLNRRRLIAIFCYMVAYKTEIKTDLDRFHWERQ